MKPQKIFIEVAVADELPPNSDLVHIKYGIGTTKFSLTGFYEYGKWYRQNGTHLGHARKIKWLKPIPAAYVFTREELEAFAKDVIRLSREMQSVSWNERDYKYNLQTLFNQLVK